MRTEHYRIAQDAIENAITFWNDEPYWHALAAQIYERMAKTKEQITHLSEAAELAPENNTFQMALGRLYFERASADVRMLKQAAICFEQILKRDARDGQALFYLASTECQLNELEKAEENARNALILEPNRAEVHQLLSEISLKNNDFQGAYEYANKALQLSPKDLRSTVMLARSLTALGRHNEALAKINTILPEAPEPKSLQMERVDIIRKINGAKAGLIELDKLLSQYPADYDILNALAKAYLEVGDPENAITNAQNALNASTDKTSQNEQANLHLLIGQVFRKSGQLNESIDHLTKAIELAPDRLEPYLELGLALKEQREYQQAPNSTSHDNRSLTGTIPGRAGAKRE
jgi:tetratricopeptide (TPR) repeat protein